MGAWRRRNRVCRRPLPRWMLNYLMAAGRQAARLSYCWPMGQVWANWPFCGLRCARSGAVVKLCWSRRPMFPTPRHGSKRASIWHERSGSSRARWPSRSGPWSKPCVSRPAVRYWGGFRVLLMTGPVAVCNWPPKRATAMAFYCARGGRGSCLRPCRYASPFPAPRKAGRSIF